MTPRRHISVLAAAITVTGILANVLIAPALPDIERAFHASGAALGAIVAFSSLPGIVLAPTFGFLADRFGRRTVVVPCLIVFGFGAIACMAAPSLPFLLFGRFLQGCGSAGMLNLAVVILGDTFDGEARNRAIGRNAAVLTASLALFPIVAGVLTAIGGWRLAFVPGLASFAVAGFTVRILPPDRPVEVVSYSDQARAARPYVLSRGALTIDASSAAVFILVFGLGLTVLPLHLDRAFDLGPAMRGLVLGIPAAASVAVSLRIAPLTRRFGTWPLVILGFTCYGVAFGAVAAAPALGFAIVATLVWGVGEALTIVPLQAYAASLAPAQFRGVIVAMFVGSARLGQFTGPLMAGLLLGGYGTDTVFAIGALFAFATGASLALGRRALAMGIAGAGD